MRMPFGKHAGELLEDIDTPYLRWLLSIELKPFLRSAVLSELRSREGGPRRDAPHTAPAPRWAEVLGTVRKRLAMQHHPDRAGNGDIMRGINLALDAVLEAIA